MSDMLLPTQAATAESLICHLERLRNAFCVNCGTRVGSHQALMSMAMGFRNAPPCLPCLTLLLKVEPHTFRDSLVEYIRSRECYRGAWNWACRDSGLAEELSSAAFSSEHTSNMSDLNDNVAASWDAGDMGCGDLVLELRSRLNSLRPGEIIQLCARDSGAREDLPAWCRLTGHTLARAEHPTYWIQRKE